VSTDHRAELAAIKTFNQLIVYLRDEMGWPIENGSAFEDLTFDYSPEELGIDAKNAAKIQEIKRLRPLSPKQPWGIFFVKFEPKKLPVVALRRILSQVALKKRASANSAERAAWAADDLLFVSNYGEGEERQISFAHFSRAKDDHDLPTLRVLGWDNLDTALHLDDVARELAENLAWPEDDNNAEAWRTRWRAAFTLRHHEVVTTSKQLSIRLAELARNIRARIRAALEIETDKGPLTKLMKAFQEVLVNDLDTDGFADMYAQTIAYGLLSARIADPHRKTADDFAANMRTNPFLRELMETFLKVGGRRGKAGGTGIDFDELGVSEVVELLDDANMEAVVRDFGDRNPLEDPVIHFYELFLKEYDPRKRMQRGVFYTPRAVVSYIVRSVDEILRADFGLADGLADIRTWGEMTTHHESLRIPEGISPDWDFVHILDPATGTGTFLVEVIDLIHKTLTAKWKTKGYDENKIDALWNEYVPRHLLTRLHGYELLMAPYAIAHLKIGLKLYETGYRFASEERARVYLTNALEPAQDFSGQFEFVIPALAHEAEAVNEVKRQPRFTVVIGNPPYAQMSANLTDDAVSLVDPYRYVNGTRIVEKSALSLERNLNDDYVKFLRLAERHLERSCGITGFITNNSYLDAVTLRGLRSHLLHTCSNIRTLNLHGDSDKRDVALDGSPDENVFEIKKGVAITLQVRKSDGIPYDRADKRKLALSDLKGLVNAKLDWLSTHSQSQVNWTWVTPRVPNYLFLVQEEGVADEYASGVSLAELALVSATGFTSGYDELLTAFSSSELIAKLRAFSAQPKPLVLEKFKVSGVFAEKTFENRKLIANDEELKDRVTPFLFSPFDIRYAYYRREMVMTASYRVGRNLLDGKNIALMLMRQVSIGSGFSHAFVTRHLPNNRAFYSTKGKVAYFPLFLVPETQGLQLGNGTPAPNLNQGAFERFSNRLLGNGSSLSADEALGYIYAVLYSSVYRHRYDSLLRSDYPRIPVARDAVLAQMLIDRGLQLIALHLLESPKLDRTITELRGGPTFEVEKISWSQNTIWLNKAQTVGFQGVCEEVWSIQIGGYQVCEKWLKDRKGRRLSNEEVALYQKIVVALDETTKVMKEIDEIIERHGGWLAAFRLGETSATTDNIAHIRPRTVSPKPEERYVNCIPLVPLKVAAGAFGDPQHIEHDDFEWVAVGSRHRTHVGMFVAQVVGKSMEPVIADGAWCLFRAPVEGTRQGKIVLVQLRDATDPETGHRYTVKRYESQKATKGDTWRHDRITLKPVNPAFAPIVLTNKDHDELKVIAELVEILEL
jgi:type I restriction-modification system DNA methylase subunit/SOS-response transcriptional repressor LexA